MPKERHHILLADRSLAMLETTGQAGGIAGSSFSFFLGAIQPDSLFYDFPSGSLSGLGAVMHGKEGDAVLPVVEGILKGRTGVMDEDFRWWIAGLTTHFLADGYWHPAIMRSCDERAPLRETFGFSERECHHWLESELEGYWVARWGPEGGYLGFLRQVLSGGNSDILPCCEYFQEVITEMGMGSPVPTAMRLRRCLFWQAASLFLLTTPAFARYKPMFLRKRSLRFLGSLMVSMKSPPPERANRPHQAVPVLDEIFTEDFFLSSAGFIASRISSLAARP